MIFDRIRATSLLGLMLLASEIAPAKAAASGSGIPARSATPCTQAPPVPTGLTSSAITPTSVNLAWRAVAAPAGCAVTYRVYSRGIQIKTGLASPSASITGLVANTAYAFTVAAVTAAGASAQSAALAVKTPAACAAAPAVPTGLTCPSRTTSSANLAWNAIASPAGCAVTYRVYSRGIQIKTGLASPSASITGLAANTAYSFTVAAVTAAGASAQSAPLAVTLARYTLTASAGAHGSISPSGSVAVDPGSSQTFAITPDPGYAISSLIVDGADLGPITSYTFSNVAANHTISAAFQASVIQVDTFGIKKLYPTASGAREWFNAWDTGAQRTSEWGVLPTDPGMVVRGNTRVTIYGASGSRTGQMAVSGSNPRIYVRDSDTAAIPPAPGVKTWNNVEVTFFASSNLNPGIGWAGMEAVVKTNHLPDSWDCQTRGYGGRFLFDGRIDFEKEVSHPSGYNVQRELGTWAGGLPLNTWIGMKLVARNCDNNAHVKLELYREASLGSETNPSAPPGGGQWELLGTYTDTGTWSAGYGSAAAQCPFDQGKTDRSLPLTWPTWSVYLRTDDDNNRGLIQHLKWLSVREIDPLP